MCYSIFFLHILPAFCLALLRVYSYLEIEFWSEQKKARGAGWSLFIALTVLFLLFFSVNCLLTFKLVTLMCINHIQRVEKIQNKSHFSGTSWKYGMLYSVSVPYMNCEYYLLPLEWTEFFFFLHLQISTVAGHEHWASLACPSMEEWQVLLEWLELTAWLIAVSVK